MLSRRYLLVLLMARVRFRRYCPPLQAFFRRSGRTLSTAATTCYTTHTTPDTNKNKNHGREVYVGREVNSDESCSMRSSKHILRDTSESEREREKKLTRPVGTLLCGSK